MIGNAGSQTVVELSHTGVLGTKLEHDRNYIPRWVHVKATTTATAGNRNFKFNFYNAAGTLIYDIRSRANQGASTTRHYNFVLGGPMETQFGGGGNDEIVMTLAHLFVHANYYFTVTDENGVDASDSVEIIVQANY